MISVGTVSVKCQLNLMISSTPLNFARRQPELLLHICVYVVCVIRCCQLTHLRLSVCIYVFVSVFIYLCLSICLSVYLSIYLSFCLSVCLSIYCPSSNKFRKQIFSFFFLSFFFSFFFFRLLHPVSLFY